MNDTVKFIEFLFDKGDTFEIRTRDPNGEAPTTSRWLDFKRRHDFAETHLPIYTDRGFDVWVGVLPRDFGSKHPSHGNILWVDVAASITTIEQVHAILEESKLPDPSCIVFSGNGFHFYWKLDSLLYVEELRPYLRGVHQALPTDNTHDTTRVMRVPGSTHPKWGTVAAILELNDNVYHPDQFPQVEMDYTHSFIPVIGKGELSDLDRQTLIDNWFPGQLHYMTLGTAGYLRLDKGYSEPEAIAEIARIFKAAGLEFDAHARKNIADTYKQDLDKVAGASILKEYGVKLGLKAETPKISFSRSPMSLISPGESGEQEFWIDGIVGPGLITLWAAEQKTGKSFAAMQMAHALMTGEDIWDMTVTGQHRVLYFQAELSRYMVTSRWDAMFGKESRADVKRIGLTDRPSSVVNLVENPDILLELAENYDVIIVDPIVSFNVGDERLGKDVRDFMYIFESLRKMKKAVILVHHTRKLDSKGGRSREPDFADVRGSSVFGDMADAIILQYRYGDSGHTRLKFRLRAAKDKDDITLFRREDGGFTTDKMEFIDSLIAESERVKFDLHRA